MPEKGSMAEMLLSSIIILDPSPGNSSGVERQVTFATLAMEANASPLNP